MYYWSRWANMATIEDQEYEARETRQSWQESDYREANSRETRPVIVVPRRRMPETSPVSSYQHGQLRERTTSSSITLDVRRSRSYTTGSRPLIPAGWLPDATTEDLLPD